MNGQAPPMVQIVVVPHTATADNPAGIQVVSNITDQLLVTKLIGDGLVRWAMHMNATRAKSNLVLPDGSPAPVESETVPLAAPPPANVPPE